MYLSEFSMKSSQIRY